MSLPQPPIAPRRPVTSTAHGETRTDDYAWLRGRGEPEVLAYLEAENAHTAAVMAPTKALQDTLFEQIRAHVSETDESAPVPRGPWEYLVRTTAGLQYPVRWRRPRGGGPEQVVLDVNELAAGSAHCSLGSTALSPDQKLLAYGVDFAGDELFELRIRDLASGADLADRIAGTTEGLAWASDNRTLFYVRPDETHRAFQVWRHVLGSPSGDDVLVFEEADETFDVWLTRSRSGAAVLFGSDARVSAEVWWVPADEPEAPARAVVLRRAGVKIAEVDHQPGPDGGRFLVVSDEHGENFEVLAVPAAPERPTTTLVPHDPEVRIDAADAFATHLVLSERTGGLERLRVVPLDPQGEPDLGAARVIALPEPAASVWLDANPEFEAAVVRIGFSSLSRPTTTYDHDLASGENRLVRQVPVPGHDPDGYLTTREWATAEDGTRIPISLVRRGDVALDGTAPLLLYGYGSYESSSDPVFDVRRLPLLERGVVFAIAHVRGGGEMGRRWWLDGRLEHKMHTFTDFIACADHLEAIGVCDGRRIVARGRSAGGLLMGAIANLRPDRWRGVVAEVPFVDVLNTMSDATIPLTQGEYDEWGNPADPSHYAAMRAYSPYDNITAVAYPDMLVTGGLNDPRVQYWEPAKFVAKLRATATSGQFLLHTDLGAGHRGPTGRYDAWREDAFTLAWILTTLGSAE